MQKSKAKRKKKSKISEEELSDLLKKSLKGKSSNTEKSDEKKKKTETNIDLQTLEFHNFFQSDNNSKTPVLERIAGSQVARPIFVKEISQNQTNAGRIEADDEFKYVSNTENRNEPKYVDYQEAITNPLERIDSTKVGRKREFVHNINREAFFEEMRYPEVSQSSNKEGFQRVEKLDVEQAGRKDPLESRDINYKKYNSKMPE